MKLGKKRIHIAPVGFEIDRVINLIYGCHDIHDDQAMLETDISYEKKYLLKG